MLGGTSSSIIGDGPSTAVINWADLVTRALLDADVPTFHLHSRWQETNTTVKALERDETSALRPKEVVIQGIFH